jgi:O-succinylbenzoate synthase
MRTKVRVDLHRVRLPLVRAFRTSRKADRAREALILHWQEPDAEGWSECAAGAAPVYFPEYIDGAAEVIERVLLPLLASSDVPLTAGRAGHLMQQVPGNELAQAAVETAVLDASLRRRGMSFAEFLGGVRHRVPVGVSVGIASDVRELLSWVEGYLADGYTRVKLKITPGWDVEPVAAVRREFGNDLALQVDANQAYGPADLAALRSLDDFGLVLVEQPFPKQQLLAHARLADQLTTPVCLDESISDLHSAATALRLGAASVINIKPARVGGYLQARAIHDLCLAQGVPVFCGGVLETGIGRAANLALAALPNFALPGDISATSRYYARDITQSFELVDGGLDVPRGLGTGALVDAGELARWTTEVRSVEYDICLGGSVSQPGTEQPSPSLGAPSVAASSV